MSKDMMTLTEVAKILGVTRQRVWQMVRSGLLHGQRVGRLWYVNSEDVRVHIADRLYRLDEKVTLKP